MDPWKHCLLGDVVNLKRGYDLPHSARSPGPFPVVSSSGITDHHSEAKVKGPGVVTGRYGTLGQVFFVETDYWPLNTSLYVENFKGNDPRFVSYFLGTLNFGSQNAAGAVPGVNRNHLHAIEVRVPPLPIQRRIAGILSAYDELIENSQRRIKILEAMARALYREWFVHFRFPGHESVPRVQSALGEIPQGWEVKKLGEVANTLRGRSYRSADLAEEGGLPFLNLKCLDRDGGFRRSGLKRYTGEFKDIHIAKKGDIVMAVTDMTQERRIVARAALVPTLDNEFGIFSMDLVRIEPKSGFPKAFLYSFLRYSSFADEVKQHANGANVLHLSPDRITDYRFAAPPTELMNRFESFVAAVVEKIDTLANKTDNLRRTRDLLLPRLLSGPIEVETIPQEVSA
jgi:type I restriction enzyme S subunit